MCHDQTADSRLLYSHKFWDGHPHNEGFPCYGMNKNDECQLTNAMVQHCIPVGRVNGKSNLGTNHHDSVSVLVPMVGVGI